MSSSGEVAPKWSRPQLKLSASLYNLCVLLKAYADESGDATGQRAFAVACLFAPEEVWQNAEARWLTRTGGAVFHAAQCEAEFARDPDRAKHKKNLELYGHLTRIIAGSRLLGRAVAFDRAAHREFFPGVFDDVSYYKCLTHVVLRVARTTVELSHSRPDRTAPHLVEFTLDNRESSKHNATLLYQSFRGDGQWHDLEPYMADDIAFDDRSNPRIQMADLVARETMKELDRTQTTTTRPRRRSLVALAQADGRLQFEILTRDYVEDWRRQAEEVARNLEATEEFSIGRYAKWLGERGFKDNPSNRFQYMVWHSSRQRPLG